MEWLEHYLAGFQGTVLAISHDRYFLHKVVTRVIELNQGKAEFYSGNYSFYAVSYTHLAYQADCGTAVSVDDLVIEVQDQSRCTVTLSGEGEVSEDGRSISFAKAGTFPVVVEATDAGGKSTQVKVPVTTRDVAAPELRVRDIIVELRCV